MCLIFFHLILWGYSHAWTLLWQTQDRRAFGSTWEKGCVSGGGISTRLEDRDVDDAACNRNTFFLMSIMRRMTHNFYYLPHPKQNLDDAVASAYFVHLQLHCQTHWEGINTWRIVASLEVGLGGGVLLDYWHECTALFFSFIFGSMGKPLTLFLSEWDSKTTNWAVAKNKG